MFFPDNKSPFFSTKVGWSCDIYSVATYIYHFYDNFTFVFILTATIILYSSWYNWRFQIPTSTYKDHWTNIIGLFFGHFFQLADKKAAFFPWLCCYKYRNMPCVYVLAYQAKNYLPFFAQRFFLLAGEKAAFCPSIFIGRTVMHVCVRAIVFWVLLILLSKVNSLYAATFSMRKSSCRLNSAYCDASKHWYIKCLFISNVCICLDFVKYISQKVRIIVWSDFYTKKYCNWALEMNGWMDWLFVFVSGA